MAGTAEYSKGMIHAVLLSVDAATWERKYKDIAGESINDAMRALKISRLVELADIYPDTFDVRGGRLIARGSEETKDLQEHMAATVMTNKNRGPRGGSRGGRGSSFSSRGGFGSGGYGSSFSAAPARGGAVRGGSSGYSRGGSTRGTSSGGGFGSGGGGGGFGANSGFGSSSSTGFGNNNSSSSRGFGDSRETAPARSNPQDNYRRGETSTSANRGFASNYDSLAESSSRSRGGDDYDDRRGGGRDSRGTYDDRRRDDRQEYGRDTAPVSSSTTRDWDKGKDDRGYNDNYGDRAPAARKNYDEEDDWNQSDRQRRAAAAEYSSRDRYDSRDTYGDRDRDRDAYGSSRDAPRRQSPDRRDREVGYRGQRYGDDDDGYDSRRRNDDGYRRPVSQHEDRAADRSYDRDEEPRRAFPSALGGNNAAASASASTTGRSVFAPQPMRRRGSEEEEQERGRYQSGRAANEPEDPVQAREPSQPLSPNENFPPGLERGMRTQPPPGLGYKVGPPPGLEQLQPYDGLKKTPTQYEVDSNAGQIPRDELEELIYQAVMMEAGRDVKQEDIMGITLENMNRDILTAVRSLGGIVRVLEAACERMHDKMEFYTDDNGDDYVALLEPHKTKAKRQWTASAMQRQQERARIRENRERENAPMGRPDEVEDDTTSTESFKSAPTSAHAAVPSEIRHAQKIWRYCRVHGHYKNTMNGIGLLLSDVAADEHINMSNTSLYKFVTRAEFTRFFMIHFDQDRTGQTIHGLYAVGSDGPLLALLGEDDRDDRERTMREDSLPSPSARSSQRDLSDRPVQHRFFHKRNDPEFGYTSHKAYPRKEEVIVTYFMNLYDFYVMPERDANKLDAMEAELYDDHCGLVFRDSRYWQTGCAGCYIITKKTGVPARAFRVTVLNTKQPDPDEVQVLFVDSGEKRVVNVRDMVPLREKYRTGNWAYSFCFQCTIEDYELIEEEEVWAVNRTIKKMSVFKATIVPLEKNADDGILTVDLSFTPPGDFGAREVSYPDEIYRRKWARAIPKTKLGQRNY